MDGFCKTEIEKLFNTERRLVGPKSLNFLNTLSNIAEISDNMKIHSFESGTACFDWTIPKAWYLNEAFIKNDKGETVLEVTDDNILNIVNGSISIDEKISYKELLSHLHYKKNLPDAVPWMHSYYGKNWGFCLEYEKVKKLDKNTNYRVVIDSYFQKDNLYIGELLLKGQSDKEVVISTYTCHPLMANDNLSGIILAINLYNELRKNTNRKFTYRFLFYPETIGSVTALAKKVIEKEKVEYSFVLTCVSYGEIINYKKTFSNNHNIDAIVADVLENSNLKYNLIDYWPDGGSDERQMSSPGIRIPTSSIMRSFYREYDQYHTSKDDLDLFNLDKLQEMSDIYLLVINRYEKSVKYYVNAEGCEPFLTKYNKNTRTLGGTHLVDDYEKIVKWLCFLGDGENCIENVKIKSGYSVKQIKAVYNKLIKMKVLFEK